MLALGIAITVMLLSGACMAAEDSAAKPLITYVRTGGIAGVDDTVTVSQDGAVQVSTRSATAQTSQLSSSELAELQALIAAADLPSLDKEYKQDGLSDAFEYRLTSGANTVRWTDGTAPAQLWPLQNMLDGLIASAQ